MQARSGDASFGAMVSCYRGDLPLLRGCLASIRMFFPTLPICLVTHGSFEVEDLKRIYGVRVLTESAVDPRLRQYSYGYGLTKMVSFWHSPYERFVHIDADAVCWGDFLQGLDWENYDFVFNEPHEIITEFIQKTQYFDPEKIDPGFDWKGLPFFNTGIFVARRGIFDIDEYLALLEYQRRVAGSLFTDQGPLNILVFRGVARENIVIREWPLQTVVPVIPVSDLRRDFRFVDKSPLISDLRRLIHWAGPKPLISSRHPFSDPMTFFRLYHLRLARSLRYNLGRLGLVLEELDARYTARHEGSYVRAARSKLTNFAKRVARIGP